MSSGSVDLFAGYPTWELRHLVNVNNVIFLLATDNFQNEEHQRRNETGGNAYFVNLLEGHANPQEIIMTGYAEATRLLSRYVREECEKNNLSLLITGGKMRIEDPVKTNSSEVGASYRKRA